MDYFRGLKSWRQFANICTKFANEDGTYLQAAQLKDPRHLAKFQEQYEQVSKSTEPYRPALEGRTALVAEISGLRNDLRRVHGLPRLEGPKTPMDEVTARKKEYSNRRMDTALGYDDKEVS